MIKHITYKGKQYPVRVSYIALKKTQEELKSVHGKELNLQDLMSKASIDTLEPMLFFALEAGHKAEEIPMTIKREEIEDVLDECCFYFVEILPDFFQGVGMEESKRQHNKEEEEPGEKLDATLPGPPMNLPPTE
jgi:hypothetical protein